MNYYLQLALLLFVFMNAWFILSLIKKRNDVADVAWGLGFVLLSWASLIIAGALDVQNIILASLVSVWGIRISWHIGARNRNKSEDFRYKTWRADWGKWFYLRSWLQVYMLQGAFLYLIALPVIMFHNYIPQAFSWYNLFGLILWCIGFFFETLSDYQLTSFKKKPENKGKIIRTGLWKYSRHPNYFGEVVLWWGIYIMCIHTIALWPAIISPLLITYLILFVSGIPMMEKRYIGNPGFEEYKKKTSVFLPLPPKV